MFVSIRLTAGRLEDAYLLPLNALSEAWVAAYELSPVCVVPGDALDFVNRTADRAETLAMIERGGLAAPLVG